MPLSRLADDLCFHRTDDRTAAALLGHTQRGQHTLLPFGCRASVTAHGGYDEGVCALADAEIHNCAHNGAEIGDTAASAGDRHRHTGFDSVRKITGQLPRDLSGDVLHHLRVKLLVDSYHARQTNVFQNVADCTHCSCLPLSWFSAVRVCSAAFPACSAARLERSSSADKQTPPPDTAPAVRRQLR